MISTTDKPDRTVAQYDMNNIEMSHLAGVLDATGTVTVNINKDESYPLDYRYRPVIRIYLSETDEVLLGKLDAYSEDESVYYTVTEDGKARNYEITKIDSMARFLEPLMPFLVSQYESAAMLLDTVIPALQSGHHETKEGFYELVGIADQLRDSRKGPDATYTQEYFKKEWDL